jgi:hypothetical protein
VAARARLDKFNGLGPFLAFATPVLFGLGVIVLICATVIATKVAQANNEVLDLSGLPTVWPFWFGPAMYSGVVLLVLSAVSGYAVAIDLEAIVQSATTSIKGHGALAAATVSLVAFIVVVAEYTFSAIPKTAIFEVEVVALLLGLGLYLVLMNAAARRPDLLGSSLTVIGMIVGGLFTGAALVIALGGWLVALVLLAPAIPLFFLWSVWLSLHIRFKARAVAIGAPIGASG